MNEVLARIEAARRARISETNPHGHQSEQLRASTATLEQSLERGKTTDRNLADAMARLRNS